MQDGQRLQRLLLKVLGKLIDCSLATDCRHRLHVRGRFGDCRLVKDCRDGLQVKGG